MATMLNMMFLQSMIDVRGGEWMFGRFEMKGKKAIPMPAETFPIYLQSRNNTHTAPTYIIPQCEEYDIIPSLPVLQSYPNQPMSKSRFDRDTDLTMGTFAREQCEGLVSSNERLVISLLR